ncbi:Chitotriosidase-1 [Armadillidium vulgare]|nr:Chitotriosidase-1 [Armadillidium vulgare]
MKRICYYAIPSLGSWDKTLKNLNPEDIDPFICTHLIIAFAKIQNNTIQPKKFSDVEIYKKVLSLKKINPELKVMLSLNSGFQNIVKDNDTIKLFAYNAAQFLHSNEFDGLDLDWEFPGWPATQNNQIERSRFTHLVHLLRNNFKFHHPAPFILSLAVAAPLTIISRSYEISKLAKYVILK